MGQNKSKVFDDYIREGSDYLSEQSSNVRKDFKVHRDNKGQKGSEALRELLSKKSGNCCQCIYPQVQSTVDWILAILYLFMFIAGSTDILIKSQNKGVKEALNFQLIKSFVRYYKLYFKKPGFSGPQQLIIAHILKPIYVLFVRWLQGSLDNRSYFASQVYMTRISFDFLCIMMPSLYWFLKGAMEFPCFFILFGPIFVEPFVYFFSVREAINISESQFYRVIRTEIESQQLNEEMWSTDDEKDDCEHGGEDGEHGSDKSSEFEDSFEQFDYDEANQQYIYNKNVKLEETDNLKSDRQYNKSQKTMTLIEEEKEKEPKKQTIYTELGGPYQVTWNKIYKPAYLCFIDLMIAIVYFFVTMIWYWRLLKGGTKKMKTMIPPEIVYYMVVFMMKFLIDLEYLTWNQGFQNRSCTVNGLYWFRQLYNFVAIICFMIAQEYFSPGNTAQQNSALGPNFMVFGMVLPLFLIESYLYIWCVIPAYRRQVYQKINKERKDQHKPHWLKGGKNPLNRQKKLDRFVERALINAEKKNKKLKNE